MQQYATKGELYEIIIYESGISWENFTSNEVSELVNDAGKVFKGLKTIVLAFSV